MFIWRHSLSNTTFWKRNFTALRWNIAILLQLTHFNDDVATCTPEFERENFASLYALQWCFINVNLGKNRAD